MRGLKKGLFGVMLVGMAFGSCFPNCCDLQLPNITKCFTAEPCTLLFTLLGGLGV